MKKQKYNCKYCNTEFEAREVDRRRGWAQFCTKSCKAFHQVKLKQSLANLVEDFDNTQWYEEFV